MNDNISSATENMFPSLEARQIERLKKRGKTRSVSEGEVLVHPGDEIRYFYVVISGGLALNRTDNGVIQVGATLTPGMFTGELSLVTGRRGMVLISAVE